MEEASNIDGILVVNKPKGITSRDVVNRVSKILKTKKIGHTGTLDPLAEGVLILTIGKCTKLSDFLTSKYKEYVSTFILGYETDTLDITGKTTKHSDIQITKEQIKEAILNFKGSYMQEVPLYSAVKIDGKKLYEYAREGKTIDLPSREVEITDIEIMSINEQEVKIRTTVSKGTYIRSLIRDIGRKLGTYATMSDLTRTKQGNISIEESYTLEDIENGNYKIISPKDFLRDIEEYKLDEESFKKVSNGAKMPIDSQEEFIKFTYKDELIALYHKENDIYRMYLKFI